MDNTPGETAIVELWQNLRDRAIADADRTNLAWLVEHDAEIRSIFSRQRISLLMQAFRTRAACPGRATAIAQLRQALQRMAQQQQLEAQAAQLHLRVRHGDRSPAVEAMLAEFTATGFCCPVARAVAFQFGFSNEELERELDLPAVVWEALAGMVEWQGAAAFAAYLQKKLREHLRSLARNTKGVRRLSGDAANLYGLLRAEFGEELAMHGVRLVLAKHADQIQDLAQSLLTMSIQRAKRAVFELNSKRGTSVVPLENLELPAPAGQPSEIEPDWLGLLLQRLERERVIPPPQLELARIMMRTRIVALEEGEWDRVWEGLALAHPEYGYSPQRWAKLFFQLSRALKRLLCRRFDWAPTDWHRACHLWLLGGEGE